MSIKQNISAAKQGWTEGRNIRDPKTGLTVAESEAQAKAEMIARTKKYLTNPRNITHDAILVGVAIRANKQMAARGYGKRWYSPKRLLWQMVINQLWTIALRPELMTRKGVEAEFPGLTEKVEKFGKEIGIFVSSAYATGVDMWKSAQEMTEDKSISDWDEAITKATDKFISSFAPAKVAVPLKCGHYAEADRIFFRSPFYLCRLCQSLQPINEAELEQMYWYQADHSF